MAEKGQDEGRGKGSGKARRGMLASLDTDEDGQITQQEFLARFSDLDENGDGIINADEVSRGRTNSMLTRLDADKDGSISEKEYLATFEALDTDGNGIVGTDEIPPQASGMRGRQKGGK